jgi:hypothetical protein
MSHYCNIYRAGPGVVTFGIYNLLGHVDGHIDVWLRLEDLKWVWAKTGNYANLVSILAEDNPVVRIPDEEDAELIWPYILRQVQATCDRNGRFILPDDQAKADEEQRVFDESAPDSWQRRFSAERKMNIYGIDWGADHVMAGCPIIEDYQPAPDDPMVTLTTKALELLAESPTTS